MEEPSVDTRAWEAPGIHLRLDLTVADASAQHYAGQRTCSSAGRKNT